MTDIQNFPSLSERSTDSKSSQENNSTITFPAKSLRKIAPNIYEIKNQNKVLKISKHMCLDFGGFDSSEDENYDQDNYDHIQKCEYLKREFNITKTVGQQANLINYQKFHRNIVVAGAPCCALEMPLYQSDFFERFISKQSIRHQHNNTQNYQQQQQQNTEQQQQQFKNNNNILNDKNSNESSGEEDESQTSQEELDQSELERKQQMDYNTEIEEIRNNMKAVLEQINLLHINNICHNDIKPENILYCNNGEGSPILIDLEFATFQQNTCVQNQKDLWEFRDLNYCAPEVYKFLSNIENYSSDDEDINNNKLINKNSNDQDTEFKQQQNNNNNNNNISEIQPFDEFKNDLYMYTVTFFVLLFKKFPNKQETLRNIQKKQYYTFESLQQTIIKLINKQAVELNVQPIAVNDIIVDFFFQGMTYDPKKRLSAKQLLQHPFLSPDYQITNFKLNQKQLDDALLTLQRKNTSDSLLQYVNNNNSQQNIIQQSSQ